MCGDRGQKKLVEVFFNLVWVHFATIGRKSIPKDQYCLWPYILCVIVFYIATWEGKKVLRLVKIFPLDCLKTHYLIAKLTKFLDGAPPPHRRSFPTAAMSPILKCLYSCQAFSPSSPTKVHVWPFATHLSGLYPLNTQNLIHFVVSWTLTLVCSLKSWESEVSNGIWHVYVAQHEHAIYRWKALNLTCKKQCLKICVPWF